MLLSGDQVSYNSKDKQIELSQVIIWPRLVQ
jgi:hypothetical protein